jgi:hypothetical protein
MTININPKDFGHDGRCDGHLETSHCGAEAVAVMLSASQPAQWNTGAPAASIAFLCAEHLTDEPVAQREHAEHNAQRVLALHEVWAALLDSYPEPVYLAP